MLCSRDIAIESFSIDDITVHCITFFHIMTGHRRLVPDVIARYFSLMFVLALLFGDTLVKSITSVIAFLLLCSSSLADSMQHAHMIS
mmetsp:Transcript_13149/g.28294  ORF Transcript_13149/g.28294 Transcript_13149/m.28294 type:complete len:87 (+) Transcript_13149:186-446(+)